MCGLNRYAENRLVITIIPFFPGKSFPIFQKFDPFHLSDRLTLLLSIACVNCTPIFGVTPGS